MPAQPASSVAASATTVSITEPDTSSRLADGLRCRAVTRERKTAWLVLILLVGFLAAVVAHYIVAQYVMRGYPYSTFLYFPYDGSPQYLPQPNILGDRR